MDIGEEAIDRSQSSDSTSELNGKNASYRNAPMISVPRGVAKLRRKGALIPIQVIKR